MKGAVQMLDDPREYADLREACGAANRRLPQLGMVDLTFGNVSVADRAAGVMAIKPSGVDYGGLRAEDIVVLRLEARPEDGERRREDGSERTGATWLQQAVVWGKLRPSSDAPTHLRLLQAFAGAGSVVHTHSRHAVAFAQAGLGIPCLGTTHADYFYGEVPVTRELRPDEVAGEYEWETGNAIVERLAEAGLDPAAMTAALVRGHGPFVWGPTAEKAVEAAFALEIVAQMAAQTLALRPGAGPLPQALVDRHFFRKHGAAAYYGQG